MKQSWNPKEWNGTICSESSDSEVEFELDTDLNEKDVVQVGPLIQMMGYRLRVLILQKS